MEGQGVAIGRGSCAKGPHRANIEGCASKRRPPTRSGHNRHFSRRSRSKSRAEGGRGCGLGLSVSLISSSAWLADPGLGGRHD